MNAAAGLYVGGKAKNVREGIMQASAALDSGKSAEKLELLVKITNA
jgi:anthranilate phosphoribosyltransferase